MTKKPIDHFSLSDCRKTLNEHTHPFLSLTMGEYEAMVSRLEKAKEIIEGNVELMAMDGFDCVDPFFATQQQWLASLEREG